MTKKSALVLKCIAYTVIILAAAVMQGTPGFLSVFGIRPTFLLGIAIVFSMFEGEFVGAILSCICGLLWDLLSGKLAGSNGVLFLILGVLIGLLTTNYLRKTWSTAIICSAAALILQSFLDFVFTYGIWGYENSFSFYLTHMLPAAGFSLVFIPLIFVLIRFVWRKFEIVLHPENRNVV